jgi:DNA-binding transcriptional MerR regulator
VTYRTADDAAPVAAPNAERSYQIGTVSTLTGIDAHTIRAWERRHGAIKPSRTSTGRRRYDDATIERLQLLKALVDCQEPIGTIADLPDADLRARLEKLADLGSASPRKPGPTPGPGPWRTALMAPGLEAQLRANPVALPELELSVSLPDRDGLLAAARRAPCEVVILELDAVGPDPLGFVQACRALSARPLVVVLYRFAQRAALARLAQAGARLVQTPLRLEQLRRSLLDHLMIEQARGSHPPRTSPRSDGDTRPELRHSAARRFDDDQLARLFEATTGIDCECPNHLSSLVSALVAFETYSRACESRDEADRRLHRRLADGTAEARAQLEALLVELCEHEGIVV